MYLHVLCMKYDTLRPIIDELAQTNDTHGYRLLSGPYMQKFLRYRKGNLKYLNTIYKGFLFIVMGGINALKELKQLQCT